MTTTTNDKPATGMRAKIIKRMLHLDDTVTVATAKDGSVTLDIDERFTADTDGQIVLHPNYKPVHLSHGNTPREALVRALHGVQTSFDADPQVEQRVLIVNDLKTPSGRSCRGELGTVKRVGECEGWQAVEVETDKGAMIWPVFGVDVQLESDGTVMPLTEEKRAQLDRDHALERIAVLADRGLRCSGDGAREALQQIRAAVDASWSAWHRLPCSDCRHPWHAHESCVEAATRRSRY